MHCTGSRSLYVFPMHFICILQGLNLKSLLFVSIELMLLWKPLDIQKSKKYL